MIHLKPVVQETEYNCGPAVIQMLLSYFGKSITQSQFIEAANISDWIIKNGTQPHHMSEVVDRVAPHLELLFKNKATVDDVEYFITEKQWPVGVNWQGLFYQSPAEEPLYPSPENGHYSIVIDINIASDSITLIDPYPDFAEQPRTFSLEWFVDRWWDIATQVDQDTHTTKKFLTTNLLFVIKPRNEEIQVQMEHSLSNT